MANEVLAVSDSDLYLRQQPSKGVPPTGPFTTALRFTEAQVNEVINKVDGEAGLGLGMYSGEALGVSFQLDWNAKGRVTLNQLPSLIFDWFCTRTTTGAGPYRHRWSPVQRNFNLPWTMLALVYGEGVTRGQGMSTRFVRDARLGGLEFTISAQDVVRFNLSGVALNWGPGIGGEGFQADITEIEPSPVNPGFNTYSWPSFVENPTRLCINSIGFKWSPNQQLAAPCLDSGEMAGVVTPRAIWEVNFVLRGDSDALALADYINTKSLTPTGYGVMKPALLKGNFDFSVKSNDNLGPNAPLNVPAEFAGHFPLQFVKANYRSDQSPNTVEIQAMTYDPNWYLEALNNLAGTVMANAG